MKRFFQYFGFVAFVSLLISGASSLYEQFPKIVSYTLMVVGGITLVTLAIRLVLGKDWVIKMGKEFFIGNDLIKALENFLKDMPNPKSETTANLLGHIIYRFTRLGLIGLVIAIIPAWLLYQQNQLFGYQNALVNTQNYRMDLQNNLMEAGRRSSLIFLMSNILDKVDEEIREQKKGLQRDEFGAVTDSIRFRLSKPLISRIVALSRAFRPYKILEGDTLSEKLVSPERGQLFVALMENNLDSLTQNMIVESGSFSYAVVQEINLKEADLNGADLIGADLRGASLEDADLFEGKLNSSNLSSTDLRGVNLQEASLRGANLNRAQLIGANLLGATLWEANLSGADLRGVDLRRTNLGKANLRGVDLTGANLARADLGGAHLNGADLREANLSKANLAQVDLRRANLQGVNLHGAYLSESYLYRVNLSGANLSEAILQGTRVSTEKLKTVRSLYKVRKLHPDSMAILKSQRPCLFTAEGCK